MYSKDAKNVLLSQIIKEGRSINEVSHTNKVSKSTLKRWLKELHSLELKEAKVNSPCSLSVPMDNSKTALEKELEIEVKKLRKEVESLIHTVSIYARISEKILIQEKVEP